MNLKIQKFLIKLQTIFLLFFLTLAFSMSCFAKPLKAPGGVLYIETRTFGSADFVPLDKLAESYKLTMNWSHESRTLELRNNYITLDFLTGSRFVIVDKKNSRLMDSSIVFSKGRAYVPSSFLTKTISPYSKRMGKSRPVGSKKKISGSSKFVVIDPGHGGKDPGAIGSYGLKEKELVLDISRRVRDILTKKGVKVRMTRNSDVYVPLVRRADIANGINADIFVSIHANAVAKDKRSISGSETFYLSKAQTASASETERLENSSMKEDVKQGWSFLSYRLKRFFLKKHFKTTRGKSIKLARAIQNKLKKTAVGKDRGIRPANFSVLRNVYCPSCLVEVGFVSNPVDASYLKKSSYRQRIAVAIANGTMDYIK